MNNPTLLLRQIHPKFFLNDEISSQAFFHSRKMMGNYPSMMVIKYPQKLRSGITP
jgi:hypothetical protein